MNQEEDKSVLKMLTEIHSDVDHIKHKLEKMDRTINGNGKPGLREDVIKIKLQVVTMWGVFIAVLIAVVADISKYLKF
jgi:preprotein translocase subunit SecY